MVSHRIAEYLRNNGKECLMLQDMGEEQNASYHYTDPDRILSKAWDLGDCNDQFVLLFVTKDGEVEFMSKGEMAQQQINEFYRVIDKYR